MDYAKWHVVLLKYKTIHKTKLENSWEYLNLENQFRDCKHVFTVSIVHGEVKHLSTEEDVRAPPLGRTREFIWQSPKQQRWALLFLFAHTPSK
jgi:hypothetical protein